LSSKSALILGATGLIGGHCLNLLLNDASYKRVVVPVRRKLRIDHPKLEQHMIDFDRLEDYSNLFKTSDLFCCLGTTMKRAGSKEAFYKVDFTYAHQAAQMASRNGTERFLLVTSIGADPHSSNFYLRVKGEIEAAILKLPFTAIHIFRPSLLLGEREEVRLGEKIGMFSAKLFSFAFVGGLNKYRPIEAEVVAAAMIEIARRDLKGISIYESDEIQSI
jgi:uncharacterized protein YbjT (DUF2867 family)